MTIYQRARAIGGAAALSTRKQADLAAIRQSFKRHFMDSIDYQADTLVNGSRQPLLVSQNKSVVTEKKIRAYPGDTLPLGGVVDCFNCKWLITEIDPNREICVTALMEQCNKEICWQNPQTKEIHRRWCTVSKPYFSNLEQNKKTTISQREYKMQLPYDEETALLDVDKRLMLEFVGAEPKTYRVTCVDTMTERYQLDGSTQGFLVLNLEQDQYIPEKDNPELMICDYLPPDERQAKQDYRPVIIYSGEAEIKMGGSAKKFMADFVDETGRSADLAAAWRVECLDAVREKLEVAVDGNEMTILAPCDRLLEGAAVRIVLCDQQERYESSLVCRVVTLI